MAPSRPGRSGLLRRLRQEDDGFSLLESVVALTIASVIFTAFAASILSAVRAVSVGKSVQQASNVAEQALEQMRSLGYDAAAMRASDLSVNEPLNLASCNCFDPVNNRVTGTGTEPLVLDDAGGVNPHVSTTSTNNTTYTIRRYVTRPTDTTTGAATKRLTVVVTWSTLGANRTRIVSTTVALSRSGLPLPDFKLSNLGSTSACTSPGGQAVYGFTLANNGARDSWNLTTAGGTQSWTFYDDSGSGSSGAYGNDDGTLPTTGSTATLGPVEPTQTLRFWAVGSVPNGASTGTWTVNVTATSAAQPSYTQTVQVAFQIATTCTGLPTVTPTASPSATPTPTPTPTSSVPPQPSTCTGSVPSANPSGGATATSYYLDNGAGATTNTAATNPLNVSRLTAPSTTTLWNYATDLSTGTAGRYLATTGSPPATAVEWRYTFGAATNLRGTGAIQLWGAPASGASATALTFTVTTRILNSTGTVASTVATQTVGSGSWGCAGMKPFGVAPSFGNGSGTSISAGQMLSVTVTVSGGPALLAYDTTTFPSQVVLPVRSGG